MIENADIDYTDGSRELDAAVWHEVCGAPDCNDGSVAPFYSLYTAEAMIVLSLFKRVLIERGYGGDWTVSIGDDAKTWSDSSLVSRSTHKSLPVAISRACLKKVRGIQ